MQWRNWRMQDFVNGVAIAVEKLPRRHRRKNYDASTNQSNNFGVSRKRLKPSTPGSTAQQTLYRNLGISVLPRWPGGKQLIEMFGVKLWTYIYDQDLSKL